MDPTEEYANFCKLARQGWLSDEAWQRLLSSLVGPLNAPSDDETPGRCTEP